MTRAGPCERQINSPSRRIPISMAVTRSFKRFICVLCVHYGHPSVTGCQPVARGQLVLVASLPLPCAVWQLIECRSSGLGLGARRLPAESSYSPFTWSLKGDHTPLYKKASMLTLECLTDLEKHLKKNNCENVKDFKRRHIWVEKYFREP